MLRCSLWSLICRTNVWFFAGPICGCPVLRAGLGSLQNQSHFAHGQIWFQHTPPPFQFIFALRVVPNLEMTKVSCDWVLSPCFRGRQPGNMLSGDAQTQTAAVPGGCGASLCHLALTWIWGEVVVEYSLSCRCLPLSVRGQGNKDNI